MLELGQSMSSAENRPVSISAVFRSTFLSNYILVQGFSKNVSIFFETL